MNYFDRKYKDNISNYRCVWYFYPIYYGPYFILCYMCSMNKNNNIYELIQCLKKRPYNIDTNYGCFSHSPIVLYICISENTS